MFYVYLIESQNDPRQRYIGLTEDLRKRMAEHNGGEAKHTSKFAPWRVVTYVAFDNRQKAAEFEKYLKHGSGHAFAKRHLW